MQPDRCPSCGHALTQRQETDSGRPAWESNRAVHRAWRDIEAGGYLRFADGLVMHLDSESGLGPRFATMCRRGESAMFSMGDSDWIGRIEDVRGRRGSWRALVFVPFTGDASCDRRLLTAAREYGAA